MGLGYADQSGPGDQRTRQLAHHSMPLCMANRNNNNNKTHDKNNNNTKNKVGG